MRSWTSPAVPDIGGVDPTPVTIPDTATGKPVQVAPDRDDVMMYVCGITPYDATHLGHAATYLLFDEVLRVCRDAGKRVRYAQNVTDVDDPLLERAAKTGEDWTALAARETELFRADMAALRVVAPDAYIGAVEAIPDIVNAITALRDRGAAYELESDLYFSIAAAPSFGEVGHLPVADMVRLSGERGGDPDRAGKKDPLDCLLWQAAREGEPAWDTSLGHGRPGWHVECAAIAMHHLGPSIDLQGGGDDLVFPHHEMSAAQASVINGHPGFAKAYLHQAMVGFRGEKMSKSRGNLVLVSTMRERGIDPMAIRLALLAHRHDTAWEWHGLEIEQAVERLAAWRSAFDRRRTPSATDLVAKLRAALRTGVDTPAALEAVDAWAAEEGDDLDAGGPAADAVDALLGIR